MLHALNDSCQNVVLPEKMSVAKNFEQDVDKCPPLVNLKRDENMLSSLSQQRLPFRNVVKSLQTNVYCGRLRYVPCNRWYTLKWSLKKFSPEKFAVVKYTPGLQVGHFGQKSECSGVFTGIKNLGWAHHKTV